MDPFPFPGPRFVWRQSEVLARMGGGHWEPSKRELWLCSDVVKVRTVKRRMLDVQMSSRSCWPGQVQVRAFDDLPSPPSKSIVSGPGDA